MMATLFDENRFENEIDAKIKAVVKSDIPRTTSYGATAVRQDSEGTWWVRLDGNDFETPVMVNTIDMSAGDRVIVTISSEDHVTTTNGNVTSPPLSAANTATYVNSVVADSIYAQSAKFGYLQSDIAQIGYAQIENADITNARIQNLTTEVTLLEGNFNVLSANALTAGSAVITDLQAQTAKIESLTANDISAAVGYIADLSSDSITAENIAADHGTIASLSSNYAQINLANVNNAWIENGVVKDAAISDAQIIGVSANKLTAGTIDADTIHVTNLSTDNLKVKKINGQPILGGYSAVSNKISGYSSKNPSAEGWYELNAGNFVLSQDTVVAPSKVYYSQSDSVSLYDQATIDGMMSDLNDRIDAQIETWTEDHVPTLNNSPASSWTTNDLKAEHVGDICYVLNAGGDYDGYTYRFAYDQTQQQYKWVLIKDNQVTAALGRITDLETFESNTTSWIEETDEGLETIRTNHTALSGVVDKTLVETVQLWYTKSNATAPSKPSSTSQVTNTDRYNGWTTKVPTYNSSYPNYFYCYQWKFADGTYDWSAVTMDTGMTEVQNTARTAASSISSYITTNDAALAALQSQVDGQLDIWYGSVNPTTSNVPASGWNTADLRSDHVGDLYYNTTDGTAWQWTVASNVYSWTQIPDSAAAAALSAAQDAQATADGKRRVFTSQPTTPYDIGDLWVTGDEVKYSSVKRNSGSYVASDWTQTATDDTMASANIKSSVQLWFAKANSTAPNKPSGSSPITTNSSITYDAWNLAVPTYSSSYPNYFYCYQQQKGDDSYQWTAVVYDRATTESMAKAQEVSSAFSDFESVTFKKVKDTVDEQSSTITNLTEATQYGGKNLLTNSEYVDLDTAVYTVPSGAVHENTEYDGVQAYYCSGNSKYLQINFGSLESGKKYTFSFDAVSNAARDVYVTYNAVSTKVGTTASSSTSWIRFTYTFEATSATYARIQVYSTTGTSSYSAAFRHFKLERGTFSTPWDYAQADLTTTTNTVNVVSQTATQNLNKISQLTQTLGTNADGTTASNDIMHRMSATETNLDGITSTVRRTEAHLVGQYAICETAANVAVKDAQLQFAVEDWELTEGTAVTVKFVNENTTASSGNTQNPLRLQLYDADSYAITDALPIRAYNNAVIDGYCLVGSATAGTATTGMTWQAGAIVTFVYDGENEVWREQNMALDERISMAESSIVQQADSIEAKVAKDGVIAAINLSTEDGGTAKISASKVNVQGVVNMINNGSTTTIDGGRITTNSVAIGAVSGLQSSLNNAKNYADNYIYADGTGIKIAKASPLSSTTYQYQTASATQFYVNGNKKSQIDSTGLEVFDGSGSNPDTVARFKGDRVTLGRDDELHFKLTPVHTEYNEQTQQDELVNATLMLENEQNQSIFSLTGDFVEGTEKQASLGLFTAASQVGTTYTVSDTSVVNNATNPPRLDLFVDGYSYNYEDSTYVSSITVTEGTSVQVVLSTAGVNYIKSFFNSASEDEGTGSLSVQQVELLLTYPVTHNNLAKMDLTGSIDVHGEGDVIFVENKDWNMNTNQSNTFICTKNAITGESLHFGVGSWGRNRGIWDDSLEKWLIYLDDDDNAMINGNNVSIKKDGTIKLDGANPGVKLQSNVNTRSGSWTSNSSSKWMGSILAYDKNGDTIYYSQNAVMNDTSSTSACKVYRSFVVQRKDSGGNNTYRNGFYLGITNDGSPYVSFTADGGRDAWRSALGISSLSNSFETKTGSATNSSAIEVGDTYQFSVAITLSSGYYFVGVQRIGRSGTGASALVISGYNVNTSSNSVTCYVTFRHQGSGTISKNAITCNVEIRAMKQTL